MRPPALDSGEVLPKRGGRIRRRNRHRASAAACRDCVWRVDGSASPGAAAQHADQAAHVVDLEYAVGYTFAPPERIGEAIR